MPSDAEFAALAEPFRPELLAHCYRMLGSAHDAEELAFIAALHLLSARQRAVLTLRDVLAFRTAEWPPCWTPPPRPSTARCAVRLIGARIAASYRRSVAHQCSWPEA